MLLPHSAHHSQPLPWTAETAPDTGLAAAHEHSSADPAPAGRSTNVSSKPNAQHLASVFDLRPEEYMARHDLWTVKSDFSVEWGCTRPG